MSRPALLAIHAIRSGAMSFPALSSNFLGKWYAAQEHRPLYRLQLLYLVHFYELGSTHLLLTGWSPETLRNTAKLGKRGSGKRPVTSYKYYANSWRNDQPVCPLIYILHMYLFYRQRPCVSLCGLWSKRSFQLCGDGTPGRIFTKRC